MAQTYSFKDVVATIVGVGGFVPLAEGAAAAEEGITVESTGDKNVMTIGAGGEGMHSLVADNSGTITVRLLKTSPVNAALQLMYDLQTLSSLVHGKNVITITDIARGDVIVATSVAFKKRPAVTYAKEGGMMEWVFDAATISQTLGTGVPSLF